MAAIETVTVTRNDRGGDISDPPIMNFLNIVNGITHVCIGAVTFIAIYYTMNIKNLNFPVVLVSDSFRQHIFLCVVGYVLLMSQSVLSYSPNNGWSMGMNNKTKTVIHWSMQILGSLLAIIGSMVKMIDQETNFNSAHGILGFMALIFTIITLITGIRNLLCSNIMNYNSFRIAHGVFGVLTLTVAYLCLCFGFDDLMFRLWSSRSTVILSVSMSVITLAGILVGAIGNIIYKSYLEC